MDRRTTLKLFALAPLPLVAGCGWSSDDVEHAHRRAEAAQASGEPAEPFFTDHERDTVRVLADMVFPADDRSPSASEVGVVTFMDFMMVDRPSMQVPFRGGLAWLDMHTRRRFGKTFVEATDEERRNILDEIAYPEHATPEVAHGVAFFNRFRDLAAAGFWSSKAGMADLRYMGNVPIERWEGAPQSEMDRLGLAFDAWEVV